MGVSESENIVRLKHVSREDLPRVGGKGANLGELVRLLSGRIRVPDGFVLTLVAYRKFVEKNGIDFLLKAHFGSGTSLDPSRIDSISSEIQEAFRQGHWPEALAREVVDSYQSLNASRTGRRDVAVRSSAASEDLPTASFAGQLDSFLNVEGEESLLDHIRMCFASNYTARVISYRNSRRIPQIGAGCSVVVQEMVRSDLASAGVAFTLDPESGHEGVVLINSSYGLGELLVQGEVVPDEFLVHKDRLRRGFSPLMRRDLGTKELSLVYDPFHPDRTVRVRVSEEDRDRYSLLDEEILELSRACLEVEDHFSKGSLRRRPMDIEWAKDGLNGRIYLVQARPETVHSLRPSPGKKPSFRVEVIGTPRPLLTGRGVGERIASGKVRQVQHVRDLGSFQAGEILVAERTDPDWEPAMKIASAVITASGGRTCHAAIVAREIGIPAVVGTGSGIGLLQNGAEVTVSSVEGEEGRVYPGTIAVRTVPVPDVAIEGLRTKLVMNISRPGDALAWSLLPGGGVGLLRMEFMIASEIRIHPLALLNPRKIRSQDTRRRIEALTRGSEDKQDVFVRRLSEGIASICGAFHPRPVVVRFSDFKSNEYANLIGGDEFELKEENPMLGLRGASRYSHPVYREGFGLECRAIRRVREVMGFDNLSVMLPFVRTVGDADAALEVMRQSGLVRGKGGLEFWMMCEVPANILELKEFSERFDGISIGSNDLTQLMLGIDRDSAPVAPLFDERNPAVRMMITFAIREAKQYGMKTSLCGQAPSDYPEFARFLVDEGIDSISLSPDALLKVASVVSEQEKRSTAHVLKPDADSARPRPL
jgi:pyruvate,water dikinase